MWKFALLLKFVNKNRLKKVQKKVKSFLVIQN